MSSGIDGLASYDPFGAAPPATVPHRRPYVLLDVFTDTPLEGNALAVVLDASGLEPQTMQRISRELNLSETVFVTEAEDEGADARLLIFTPAVELPFAGHPVLGAAVLLGGALRRDTLALETGAGVVPIALSGGPPPDFGWMDQPLPVSEEFAHEAELLAALGLGSSTLPVQAYRNGPTHVFVGVEDAATLAALAPDLRALERVAQVGVSCFVQDGTGVQARMFAPALGVAEDPATGSAAGPLAVHLARHGTIAYGEEIEISQGVQIGRPSRLHACAERGPDGALRRVRVGGSAVIVGRGELAVG